MHDAATTNTGTMPGAGDAFVGAADADGDATGARTARTANDTIGTSETNSVITAVANQVSQAWGHRRFVSAPLAAQTFAAADGNWTFSFAGVESNANHNGFHGFLAYLWRPSTGLRVGSGGASGVGSLTGGVTKTAYSQTSTLSPTTSCLDGDILVFEIRSTFTQGMSVAYTDTFYYDGTTEASTTSCASFITPPAALTLFTGSTFTASPIRVADQAVNRSSVY